MNDVAVIAKTPIHETLRIGGEKTDRDERIEVFNPWGNSVVGTVPCATREDVARAFDIAAAYTPTLTRYERQQILMRTAEILLELRGQRSIIVIEHDMDFVRQLDAPVTVLSEGKIMSEGSMEEVQSDPRVIEAYIGR